MAGEVDSISLMLGELRSHAEQSKASTDKLFEKIDGIEQKIARISEYRPRIEAAEAAIQSHEARLDGVDSVKHQAVGAAAAVSGLFGLFGWLFK